MLRRILTVVVQILTAGLAQYQWIVPMFPFVLFFQQLRHRVSDDADCLQRVLLLVLLAS